MMWPLWLLLSIANARCLFFTIFYSHALVYVFIRHTSKHGVRRCYAPSCQLINSRGVYTLFFYTCCNLSCGFKCLTPGCQMSMRQMCASYICWLSLRLNEVNKRTSPLLQCTSLAEWKPATLEASATTASQWTIWRSVHSSTIPLILVVMRPLLGLPTTQPLQSSSFQLWLYHSPLVFLLSFDHFWMSLSQLGQLVGGRVWSNGGRKPAGLVLYEWESVREDSAREDGRRLKKLWGREQGVWSWAMLPQFPNAGEESPMSG